MKKTSLAEALSRLMDSGNEIISTSATHTDLARTKEQTVFVQTPWHSQSAAQCYLPQAPKSKSLGK